MVGRGALRRGVAQPTGMSALRAVAVACIAIVAECESALIDQEMTFQCQRERLGCQQDWTYHPILLSLCPLSTLWLILMTVTRSQTTKSSEGLE